MIDRQPYAADEWRLALPGFCASFVSIGIARFAYTPLLPAIISAGWFGADSAAYLGAANLAGYLVGVIGAELAARKIPPIAMLRSAMLLASASMLAGAWPGGFGWFFSWRLLSGIAGGIAMILAAPAILPHVAPAKRGLVGGAIFMGVGFGIALSGTLVPLLLVQGLTSAWLGLAAAAALLTLVGWNGWRPLLDEVREPTHSRGALPLHPLRGLYLLYGLNALALVPHMVFLVDFVARGLGQGLASGTQYWMLYGLGAMVGPLLAGRAADRWGPDRALIATLLIQLAFIALPAFSVAPAILIGSSLAVGACTIGIVPLVLGRTREILVHHPSAQVASWRSATACFALFQAVGAYFMSFLFDWSRGSYALLFIVGAASIMAAILVFAFTQWARASDQPSV